MSSADQPASGDSGKLNSPQQRQMVKVDDSQAVTAYSNFCRVTGTTEELIIDFGLNAQPYGQVTEPVIVSQRLVMNYYTAKRMAHALQLTIQRHEATFGAVETDPQKRVLPGLQQQSPNNQRS